MYIVRPENTSAILLTPRCLVKRDIEHVKPKELTPLLKTLLENFRALLRRFGAPEQLLIDEIYLRSNGYFGKNSSYEAGCGNLTLSRCKFA